MQTYTLNDKKTFDTLLGNKPYPSEIEKRYIDKAYKYIKYISWIPGIQMVGVGNSLSMNGAKKSSDIDLFIVSAENRMWIVRIVCTLIFQILGVRKNTNHHSGRMCLSFFCTVTGLDFQNFVLKNDPYLYFWSIYLKPLLDYNNTYSLFIEKNSSWGDFSNFSNIIEENKKYIMYKKNTTIKSSRLKKVHNIFLKTIDTLLKKLFLPKTLKHYENIGKPFGVIIHEHMLKFHNGDIRKDIRKKM